ncbi:MAG: MBL fold metallo-hydrolase [Gemmatimonadetes bacterium]|nr:MBL fold metallo-hydrolase [Gemmatimonadota bacterium]HCK90068.1 MBL fold metallo-hydrolase [Gemmatimonadota bacterium]|tara:strand:- start:4164 stop:4976 length:813 start_codon:yes stop_codon:yes gene_type:complete
MVHSIRYRSRDLKQYRLAKLYLWILVGTLVPTISLHAQTDSYPAANGALKITPFVGAGVQIEYSNMVVHVDPWSRGDYSEALPADVILITDTPADHLDPDLIQQLIKTNSTLIVPAFPEDARDEGGARRLRQVSGALVMENEESVEIELDGNTIMVESVAMYDLIPGQPFHAKGEGNGYIVTMGGLRIYLAGVTECTIEMQAIEDIDIAFVPMNLPNGRMPPARAAECVKIIEPNVVYPYHYREQPIEVFIEALRNHPTEVRVRDWYPGA